MCRLTIGIFNDSFPPTIDGVANTTINYAREIHKSHGTAIVATPWYPNVTDDYPFQVIRYPSAYISKKLGYRAGNPLDPSTFTRLRKADIDLIHSHSPFISLILARLIRFRTNAPIVFTYHTKFDIELNRIVPFEPLRAASAKILLSNINACDEVWVVSEGAGENLRNLGYTGDYIIMENGSDFPKGKSPSENTAALKKELCLSESIPIFLFVGRLMWYKGIKHIADGLKSVKQQGYRFKMIFVGDGYDKPEIQAYINKVGLDDDCIFTGAIYDRELLRTYYSLADLFVFPSTFDTNGIAVTEAAACYCPSLLIEGSCAAERIEHKETGLLIKEDPAELSEAIIYACNHPEDIKRIGTAAADKVYISWEDAVAKAYERYMVILENYVPRKDSLTSRLTFIEDLHQLKIDLGSKKKQLIDYYHKKEEQMLKELFDQWLK